MRYFLFVFLVLSFFSCKPDLEDELNPENGEKFKTGKMDLESKNLEGELMRKKCRKWCSWDGYPWENPVEDPCNVNAAIEVVDWESGLIEICFDVQFISVSNPYWDSSDGTKNFYPVTYKQITQNHGCVRFILEDTPADYLLEFGYAIDVYIQTDCSEPIDPIIGRPGVGLERVICTEDCNYDSYMSQWTGTVLNDCNLNPQIVEIDPFGAEFKICFDTEIQDASFPYYDEADDAPGEDPYLYWEYQEKWLSEDRKCMVYEMSPAGYEVLRESGFIIDVKKVIDCNSPVIGYPREPQIGIIGKNEFGDLKEYGENGASLLSREFCGRGYPAECCDLCWYDDYPKGNEVDDCNLGMELSLIPHHPPNFFDVCFDHEIDTATDFFRRDEDGKAVWWNGFYQKFTDDRRCMRVIFLNGWDYYDAVNDGFEIIVWKKNEECGVNRPILRGSTPS